MTFRKFFALLNVLSFAVIIFCDIAPMAWGIVIPAMVSLVAHIVLTVSMVLSLGFKGFVKFIISLVLMYVIYVLLTGGLMLLGLTYELSDIIGTIVSVAFLFVVSSKI